jgi:hypothetical protein
MYINICTYFCIGAMWSLRVDGNDCIGVIWIASMRLVMKR